MSFRVKITAKGWEGFNGNFCSHDFLDGVSVETLPRLTIDRIASIIECQLIDDGGVEVGQAGVAARLVSLTDVTVPILDPLRLVTPAEQEAETQAAIATALNAPANVSIYTQEQLEAIGSKEGIGGLRAIGDKWRVKGRSINQVIFEILRAQSEYKARSAEKDNELKAARAAAQQTAIETAAAREVTIASAARNLSAEAIIKAKQDIDKKVAQDAIDQAEKDKYWHRHLDGTPNAVDASGQSVYVAPETVPVYVDPQLAEVKAS